MENDVVGCVVCFDLMLGFDLVGGWNKNQPWKKKKKIE
jgi:hypothetical protein